jgi:hypothetical protein
MHSIIIIFSFKENTATGTAHYLTYLWKQSNISLKIVKIQDFEIFNYQ